MRLEIIQLHEENAELIIFGGKKIKYNFFIVSLVQYKVRLNPHHVLAPSDK